MLRFLFAALLSLSFAQSALGEEYEPENGVSQGMGMGGTVHRTWGFNYRQYFDSNIGITINFGGWLYRNHGHICTAIGTSYTFAHHKFTSSNLPQSSIRVYGVAYAAGIYEKRYRYQESSVHSFDLGLGVGPGAEFFFTRNFAIHLELPWMTFLTIEQNNTAFARSYPNFGGGISYYF